MNELTPQQRMILNRKDRDLEISLQTGDHLDSKAATIIQAGGFIIALTGAVSLSTLIAQQPGGVALAGLIVAFAAFAAMIGLSLRSWIPSNIPYPGTRDWDDIQATYLSAKVDLEQCYDQMLSDILGAIDASIERNSEKARDVTIAAWLLIIQVAGILVLSLF